MERDRHQEFNLRYMAVFMDMLSSGELEISSANLPLIKRIRDGANEILGDNSPHPTRVEAPTVSSRVNLAREDGKVIDIDRERGFLVEDCGHATRFERVPGRMSRLLVCLADKPDRIISPKELFGFIWPDEKVFLEGDTRLSALTHLARKKLREFSPLLEYKIGSMRKRGLVWVNTPGLFTDIRFGL